MRERFQAKESLFEGAEVYFSASIVGAKQEEFMFASELVKYMKLNGANVLSEHVSEGDIDKRIQIFAKNIGMTPSQLQKSKKFERETTRQEDHNWVDKASHFVALLNMEGSYGVGTEFDHTVRKPQLGGNSTPMLCLIPSDLSLRFYSKPLK